MINGAIELAYARINTIVFPNLHAVNHIASVKQQYPRKPVSEKEFLSQGFEPDYHRSVALGSSAEVHALSHSLLEGDPLAGVSGFCSWVPIYSRRREKASKCTKHQPEEKILLPQPKLYV